MWKDLLYNFKKTVGSIYFFICIVLLSALSFTSVAYVNENMQEYNVLECLLFLNREEILMDSSLCNLNLFQNGLDGYLSMFLPMLVAFPFVYTYCQERKSGLIRMSIIRTSKTKYIVSKYIVAVTNGSLVLLFGYAIYGGLLWILFPSPADYGMEAVDYICNGTKSMAECIAFQLLIAALYGGISTCFTLVLLSVMKNEYIICSLPFLALYINNVAINRIVDIKYQNGEKNIRTYLFSPDAIASLGKYDMADTIYLVKIMLVYVVICFILYYIGMNKRWDFGE